MNRLITTLALAAALTMATSTRTYADDTTKSSETTCEDRLEAARVLSADQLDRIDELRVGLEGCESDHADCLTDRDRCAGRHAGLAAIIQGLRVENADLRQRNATLVARTEPAVPTLLRGAAWGVAVVLSGLTGHCVGRCAGEITVGLAVGGGVVVVGVVVLEAIR